ncbi:alpha/beta fold hydrolase [Corynebacterium auriscanis]|uniref:alpha/beta fold hydrolase n=1 Tax=Corynebacterium auriscanis TaxID=99807 RepID=UPI00224803FD|nr:alpha/beta fold hydrolase [Corynebacterium auriscanis]MCX2162765.1 alpha/beta fold hydrolase [Corynebacterium auriscanis]
MNKNASIAIIGSGFGGLATAIELKRAGFHNFTIYEKAGDIGGVWRDNDYPGAACDVQSYLYSFSHNVSAEWEDMFARQGQIWEYLQGVVDKEGLWPHVRCNTEVIAAQWQPERASWRMEVKAAAAAQATPVETTTGSAQETNPEVTTAAAAQAAPVETTTAAAQAANPETTATTPTHTTSIEADHLVVATGALAQPVIPRLPGLDEFQGEYFHSAEWNHDVDLRGKRVAVVGTGASAIQIVPAIQPEVESLTLFQRTPAWVMPRHDRSISAAEQQRLRKLPILNRLRRWKIYLQREVTVLGFRHPVLMGPTQKHALRHLESQVTDPEKRRKLTPSYRIGCKRILLSNTYYPAVNAENTTVVCGGVKALTAHGVVDQDGKEHPVDVVIFATGFKTDGLPLTDKVCDAAGLSLAEKWGPSPRAYLGTSVAGYPNCYLLHGPNIGLGHTSVILMFEAQARYIRQAVELASSRTVNSGSVPVKASIAPTPRAQRNFDHLVGRLTNGTVWTSGGCDSWYLDQTGHNSNIWPGSTLEYILRTRRISQKDHEVVPLLTSPADGALPPGAAAPAAPVAGEATGVANGVQLAGMQLVGMQLDGMQLARGGNSFAPGTAAGGSTAPVVMLHGLGGSPAAFDRLKEQLDPRVNTVALALGDPRTIESDARSVIPTIREEVQRAGRKAVLVGHSRGGLVATAVAEIAPELVEHLVLVNATPTTTARVSARSAAEVVLTKPVIGNLIWKLMTPAMAEKNLATAFAPNHGVPPQFVRDLRNTSLPDFLAATGAIDRYLKQSPMVDRLREVHGKHGIPTTAIVGQQDGRLAFTEFITWRGQPGIRVVDEPNAGHAPIWETPETVAAEINDVVLGTS